jgi:two-component system phosphate regulon sensor histidine kinase PhoR
MRLRLIAIAAVAGFAGALVTYSVVHGANAAELGVVADAAPLAIGVGAFTLALVAGGLVYLIARRPLQALADNAREVARDTGRRVPAIAAPPSDDVRQIAEWINFLADDADRSHRALARERELLSTVAEGLTQGVIAVDGEHKIELLNDAARRMLGVQSSPVGEPLIEFVRVPQVFTLLTDDEADHAEVELTPPIQLTDGRAGERGGGVRTMIRVAHKYGGDGRVLFLEDVTNVRRLETVRRDFVANVSHELRTPVAVIRANAETLLAGAKDDPVMAPKLIDGLHRNAERLARILADLLDLSRLDAGQYRLDIGTVPLRTLAEQSLTAVEHEIGKRKVTVEIEIPGELAVAADPKALDQILVNLIDNAVKYTRAEGHVWIAAKRDGDGVRVEVRDDGPGIAAKHRERVFERFYRADPSRSREAGGTGLGLSIVKHLAQSMHGAVGVEPNSPAGCIFWLRLPLAS